MARCIVTQTTTTTTILRPYGLCPRRPGLAGTRRNIHQLTPIVVINHPLSASSIFYDPWHPHCSVACLSVFFHNLSPSFLWSTSWPGILHFILHTFLHPISLLFAAHAHTITTCFAVVPKLCYLILVSLSTIYWKLYLVA